MAQRFVKDPNGSSADGGNRAPRPTPTVPKNLTGADPSSEAQDNLWFTLFEVAPDATIVTGYNGEIILANAAVARMFGYDRGEVIGQPIEILVPERMREVHRQHFAAYVEAPDLRPMGAGRALLGLHKNGHEFPIDVCLSPIRSSTGLLVVSAIRDASDRIDRERALQISEEQYRLLAENGSDLVVALDGEGRITYVSQKSKDVFGVDAGEALGALGIDFVHSDDRAGVLEATRRVRDEGIPGRVAYRPARRDGEERWYEASYNPYTTSDGQSRIVAVLRDVTDQRQAEAVLRESEERFRSLAESGFDYVAELDLDGKFTYASPRYESLLGRPPEALLGASALSIIFSDDRAAMGKAVERVVAAPGAGRETAACRVRDQHGALLRFEVTFSSYRAAAGDQRVILVSRDITEQHKAEEQRRQSEDRYRSLAESGFDFVAETDDAGRFTYVNEEAAALLGYAPDDLMGTVALALIHPADQARVDKALRTAWHEQTAAVDSYRVIAMDGTERWMEGVHHVYEDSRGERRTTIVARDVTDQRQADAVLRESEERYRLLAETGYDLVSELDEAGRFIYANENFRHLLGYDPATLVGKTSADLVHPEDRALVTKARDDAWQSQDAGQSTHRVVAEDGTSRWYDVSYRVYEIANGERRMVVIGRDVTEQRLAAERARELTAHVERAQRMDSVGNLAGGIAHDFNNLLTVVLANLDLAALEASGNVREGINEASAAARKAAELSKQLLAIGRSTAGPRTPLPLAPIVADVMKMLERTIEPNVRISQEIPERLTVIGNAVQLGQVLMNLAINARDAMPKGGSVVVRAFAEQQPPAEAQLEAREAGYVVIEVEDSGFGMDAETLSRMFDPFFTTKGDKGTGLGASVVYGIVREHKGMITVESAPGEGTTLRIYLPAAA